MGCQPSKEEGEPAARRYLESQFGKRPTISAPFLQDMELALLNGRRQGADGTECKSHFRTVAEISLDIGLPSPDDRVTEEDDGPRGIFRTGRDRFNFIKTTMMVLSANGYWNIKDCPINLIYFRARDSVTNSYHASLIVMEKDGFKHQGSVTGTKPGRDHKWALIHLIAEVEYRLAAILASTLRNSKGPRSEFDAKQDALKARQRELEKIRSNAGRDPYVHRTIARQPASQTPAKRNIPTNTRMPGRGSMSSSSNWTARAVCSDMRPYQANYNGHAIPWNGGGHAMEAFMGGVYPYPWSMAHSLNGFHPGHPTMPPCDVWHPKQQHQSALKHTETRPATPGPGQPQFYSPTSHMVEHGPDPRSRVPRSSGVSRRHQQHKGHVEVAESNTNMMQTNREQRMGENDLGEVKSMRHSRKKIEVLESRPGSVRTQSSRRGNAQGDQYEMAAMRKPGAGSSQH